MSTEQTRNAARDAFGSLDGRGGARTSTPGSTYSNRSDLSGDGGGRKQAVKRATPNTNPAARVPNVRGRGPQPPPPGSLQSLTAPSERSSEPVTAGLALGPGAGPDSLALSQMVGQIGATNPELDDLRAIYRQFPYESIRRMIEKAEREQ